MAVHYRVSGQLSIKNIRQCLTLWEVLGPAMAVGTCTEMIYQFAWNWSKLPKEEIKNIEGFRHRNNCNYKNTRLGLLFRSISYQCLLFSVVHLILMPKKNLFGVSNKYLFHRNKFFLSTLGDQMQLRKMRRWIPWLSLAFIFITRSSLSSELKLMHSP